MSKIDLKAVISQVEPTTKVAQLRQVMPEIEEKLAAGVTLAQLHKAMTEAGFEVAFETLKTYLYQHRRKSRQAASRPLASASSSTPPELPSPSGPAPAGEHGTPQEIPDAAPPQPGVRPPVAPDELVRLMRPDPEKHAADFAELQRLGKEMARRKRKPST